MGDSLKDLVRTTTRSSLILLLGQVSSTAILAVGMLLVARLLGPINFGSYSKAQSVVSTASILMNLGVNQAMVYHLARLRHQGEKGMIKVYLETGAAISLGVSTIFALALLLSSGFIARNLYHEPQQEVYLKVFSLSLVGQGLSLLAQGVTVGFERMHLRSLLQVSYSLFKSLVSPLLVFMGLGTIGAVVGHTSPILLSGALGALFVAMVYREVGGEARPLSHVEAARSILGYGFPLYLSNMMTSILPQIFTVFLASQVSNYHLGNYAVTLYFSVLLSFITMPIATAVFPLFSKLEKEEKALGFLYTNAVKYTTLLGYPIIFAVLALSDEIVETIFQDKYPLAGGYLRLFILGFLTVGLGSVCNGSFLNGQGRSEVNFRSTLAKFLVSIPLGYLGVKLFGVEGLLVVFIVGSLVNTGINIYYIKRDFGFTPDTRFLAKVSGVSLASCLVAYTVVKSVVLTPLVEMVAGGIAFAVCYLVGVAFSEALTPVDLRYLEELSDSFGPLSPFFKKILRIIWILRRN